jgi:hypothetical protein
MKKSILTLIGLSFTHLLTAQGTTVSNDCVYPQGNIAIFSNYDGGVLNIDVDQNIPNLKIGIVSFAGVQINISGVYAANVTEVQYAGIKTNGDLNCNNPTDSTTITGVNPAITSILLAPPHSFPTAFGYNAGIICGYSCDTTIWQGGCNTYDQIENYFETVMNGTSFMFKTQYECWSDTSTQLVSLYGNCVPNGSGVTNVTSSFTISDTLICINQGIDISNMSSPIGTTVWSIPGSNQSSSSSTNLTGVSWATTGAHQVFMQNSGCPIALTVNVVNCADLEEILFQNCIAYPNPSKSTFKITGLNEMETIILSDLSGKTLDQFSPSEISEIDLSSYSNGSYLLQLSKNGFVKTLRLIKE